MSVELPGEGQTDAAGGIQLVLPGGAQADAAGSIQLDKCLTLLFSMLLFTSSLNSQSLTVL